MENRFDRHYTREEARALLPQIRKWLELLNRLRKDLDRYDKRLSGLTEQGHDYWRQYRQQLDPRAGQSMQEGAGRVSATGRFSSKTWSAAWLISPPSWAARRFFSAGNRTKTMWNSGMNSTPASAAVNGYRI